MLAAASLLGLMTGCTDDAGLGATTDTSGAHASAPPDTADDLLFVVRSTHGRVVLDASGRGTLTMDGIDDVTWFSDRPARDAGESTIRQALGTYGWAHDGDAVSVDAPNATLTAPELGDDALVVELLAASLGDEGVSFEVQTIAAPGERDDVLSDLDLFIDTTTADPTTADSDPGDDTSRPDPAAVAASAGFGAPATLVDHLRGLLTAVDAGADPGAAQDRTVQLAVRASFTLGPAGLRSSVPVLLAPPQPVGTDPSGLADEIRLWLSTHDARIDTLVFDVTVQSTEPRAVVLDVHDVELPLRDVVDLPTP